MINTIYNNKHNLERAVDQTI